MVHLTDIKKTVEEVTKQDIEKQIPSNKVLEARDMYFHLARNLTRKSYECIGKVLNRDAETAYNGKKTASLFIENSPEFRNTYNKCRDIILNINDN